MLSGYGERMAELVLLRLQHTIALGGATPGGYDRVPGRRAPFCQSGPASLRRTLVGTTTTTSVAGNTLQFDRLPDIALRYASFDDLLLHAGGARICGVPLNDGCAARPTCLSAAGAAPRRAGVRGTAFGSSFDDFASRRPARASAAA